jgi:cyclase
VWTFRGIASLAVLALFPVALAQAQPFLDPRVVKIGERVHVLLGPVQHANSANQGYMINATVIVGSGGVILVDSGSSLEVGKHIARAVRRITDKRVTHVVNTHPHGDHYLGNAAFPGATVMTSEMCRTMVAESGHEWIGLMERDIGRKLPGTRAIPADVTFAPGRTERVIHGVRLVAWVPKGSHTAGDLLLYLPDDKVLVAGDVLVNGIVPTLQDGFIRNWIGTLDEIAAVDAAHFVPGHGGVMKREQVIALRAALDGFYTGVKRGYRSGLDEGQIRKSLDLSAWQNLERSYVIGRNINRAWLEAEAESFEGR